RIDNPTVKISTGIDKLVAVFASSGRKSDAILGTNGTRRHATNAPTAPAIRPTSKLSKTNNRTMPAREAPIAIRNAIPRRRQLKRLGRPNFGNRIRPEPGYRHVRQNSDDRVHCAVKCYGSTDHIRVAAEAFLPEIFRHQCDVRAFFLPGQKIPAANRAHSEDIKIVRG